jgi:hypothetical protein
MIGLLGALGVLVGCGGNTNSNPTSHANPGGSSNSESGAATAGGATSSGATNGGATSGSAGQGVMTSVDGFDTADKGATLGLWMGFPTDMLPIGVPPAPHDGPALHLVGESGLEGLDVYYHTPLPLEKIYTGMRFWTMSQDAGSRLTVAVAGPWETYFEDREQGLLWPERVLTLEKTWQEVVVNFTELEPAVDADHLSPHSEMYGAFHFIIEPNTKYDLWIDDLVGVGGPG